MNPRYQDVSSDKIPTVEENGVKVKIIAGKSMGKQAEIDTRTPIIYLHYIIQQGAQTIQKVPENYNVFVYVINGKGLFGKEEKLASKEQSVFFERNGNEVIIKTSEDADSPLEVLLIAGVPLEEPVARYGPFVMNTEDELRQAVADYNSGKMGKIDF
ncbi:MAG: pirin family protein [Nitrosopumilus sp.]